MRAVFDTNVVVSALIFSGRLAWLRAAWQQRLIVPVICRETTAELLRVLAYPKFRLSPADRAALLEDYLPHAEVLVLPTPWPVVPVACRDITDEIFLVLAATANIPLISGDADLTVLAATAPISILSTVDLQRILTE